MKWWQLAVLGVIGLVVFLVSSPGPAIAGEHINYNHPLFQKLEKEFICVDGCEMALEICTNPTAEQMRIDLDGMIKKGMTENEIISYMISIYGEGVLREPLKQGFSLTAWILPFVALLAGALLIYLAVDRWIYRRVRVGEVKALENEMEQEIYQAMIDEERKKYF
ncbi:cytochrome c-type biogenesis protein CcmH [Microaerobacter geothermalis]|uniref:cytochrome c-type biogenesis protein n=1 Tax=Microaerobacter geothermalis TaxID=674972 RepID=UPI001F43EBEC|nr:cytochrome c-type biogenesis protein CcmH [Microaerobacter geothermalis]MCF6095158.1 cytochrome c-type biogenesis protein CcmH [Microaerobacter geothermalis]